VSNLNEGGVQDRWLEAKAARERFERIRSGPWEATRQAETVCFAINLGGHGHQIEVDHHGIDLADCPNPTAAIAKVRARA
jgi:hypothetical protein